MCDNFQIFFKTSKGGCQIEYEAARAEFFSVFRDKKINVLLELPFRMRMNVNIQCISENEVIERAKNLGYTQGILHCHEEPYLGEELHAISTARWVVGWIRIKDKKLFLREIYRQDEDELIKSAPHNRDFLIERDGKITYAKGHRYHRGISPNDAKFIINIAELKGDEIILDPYAGIGGIILECKKRNLRIFASDVDVALRPGLAIIAQNKYAVADACCLPFKDNTFDVVITEPPFNTKFRQSVIDSLPELSRVNSKTGKFVFLIADDMYSAITETMLNLGFCLTADFTLRRHGKLKSHVLKFETNS